MGSNLNFGIHFSLVKNSYHFDIFFLTFKGVDIWGPGGGAYKRRCGHELVIIKMIIGKILGLLGLTLLVAFPAWAEEAYENNFDLAEDDMETEGQDVSTFHIR